MGESKTKRKTTARNAASEASYDYDLICIGSGPAGQRAAVQAAKLGQRVAVIEKCRIIGGVCNETGTNPSKTFREAVRAFCTRRNHDTGLGFRARIRPSIDELLASVNGVIANESAVQQDAMQRNDINIINGTAKFTDAHTVHVATDEGDRSITAAKFLVAVGTTPARPRGVDIDAQTIIVSDGVLNMTELPRTMIVVGAGVIGIEYASMFARLGVDVTVVDGRDRPMEFLDNEIIDELIYQMRSMEVTFRLGEKVEKMSVRESPRRHGIVELESGKRLVADLVLYSVGRQGATEKLGLEHAGLEADNRGRIKVDKHYRTDQPHIYAAGDVIGFPSLAATSAEQGRIAACHMFDGRAEPMPKHFPIGIYAIPEISMVGATEQELTEQKVPYEIGIARYREIARGHILGDNQGMFKMIFHRETGQLLGAHAIGTGATELIHVGQAVFALGGGLDYFLNTVFNYPTLAECYKVAALNAANKLNRFAEQPKTKRKPRRRATDFRATDNAEQASKPGKSSAA